MQKDKECVVEIFYKDSSNNFNLAEALFHFLSRETKLDTVEKKAKKFEYFTYAIDTGATLFFAVFDSCDRGQIAGGAFLFRIETKTHTTFEVQDVHVFPEYEGRGYGTELMSAIIDFVKGSSMHRGERMHIMLSSKPKRVVANHMYKKLGFTLAATAVPGESIATNLYLMVIEP